MRVCGGGCGGALESHYASGRGLLGAAVAPPPGPQVEAPSFEAQRAHLERALGAATTVLFLASVSYVALTAFFGCLCAGGGGRRDPGEPQLAVAEETKRALQEIPVVVVVVPAARDPAAADPGGPGDRVITGGGAEGEEAEECAVCLAEYASGEEVRVLPACRHGFHRECVDRWLLTRAPTCPVCRAPVAARHEGPGAKACATGDAAALV
ncbi:unnamed protein product [Urochloa decumbens]|uniref:RING-type domain-containing protein n=1 Tax=Urochloa decumbens TaxID=240449 RepID=A0ABC9G5G5_9POAL